MFKLFNSLNYTIKKSYNFRNMKKIFPILRLDRTELKMSSSEITNNEIKDFGNGFFISNKGLFASVAHALIPYKNKIPYAFINDMLYKIDIIINKHGFTDEVYEDFTIGKIDFDNKDWFDVNDFNDVSMNDDLLLMGYSRNISFDTNELFFDFDFPIKSFFEIPVNKPFDQSYLLRVNDKDKPNILQHNSFPIVTTNIKLCGLSGSPVVNKNNKNEIFGILKGGVECQKKSIAQVFRIDVYRKLIDEALKK